MLAATSVLSSVGTCVVSAVRVEKKDGGGEKTSGFLCLVCFNPQ